ncbi:MAG: SPFH domain-containing protein [Deltaproteobacteria bacterium]|jgi:regulator of protease activity HflC (stomatin/prohibitin superfamily)|nr:SPFH domain-containing protein [Deltaproteobacteria bacterium]
MDILLGVLFGFVLWFFARYGLGGFYTIGPNERAVLCTFGRAQRLEDETTLSDPIAEKLKPEERQRYEYPQVRVVGPGFHWKLPWQTLHRTSVATQTVSIAFDPEDPSANSGGQVLEAVTKDQLNTGLGGQIRFTVSERNLYACLFGVKKPVAHVLGYFVSILRDRIANFEAEAKAHGDAADPADPGPVQGISINDLRKNLRDLNERMDIECETAAARYGIHLDAALITAIDPPPEVDSALAAINTAHNHVSSEISLAQAAADQRIVQSKRAVEIETLNAQAEVEPLLALAAQLRELAGNGGPAAVEAYVRNAKIALHHRARHLVLQNAAGGAR